MYWLIFRTFVVILAITCIAGNAENEVKIRKKRVIWMKNRKLILPQGSTLQITPRLQIPFLRQPPEGINSDISASWTFYMFFDKLGMTDEAHPWPPFFPFSDLFLINRRQGTTPAPSRRQSYRKPRDVVALPPPERMPGGERAIIVPQLEKLLESFGLPGRACLLRAVCEVHEFPLHEEGYGLFGEFITLIFSISKSRYSSSHLPEYLKAEEAGTKGNCYSYFKKCTKSIFQMEANKYSEEMQGKPHFNQNDLEEDEVKFLEDDVREEWM